MVNVYGAGNELQPFHTVTHIIVNQVTRLDALFQAAHIGLGIELGLGPLHTLVLHGLAQTGRGSCEALANQRIGQLVDAPAKLPLSDNWARPTVGLRREASL